jgi:hypothetical protein
MRRREFIVAVGVAGVSGCIGGGYDTEAVKSDATTVPREEMSEGDRIHVEKGYVRQIQSDGERYFISTEQQDGEWTKDIFGKWEGDSFQEEDTVELWGVVEGDIEAEGGEEIPEVTIVDMQAAD